MAGQWYTDPRVISAALALGGGMLQSVGESKNADANRQLSREELLARQYENEQQRKLQQQSLDQNATQLDPLAQQKSRQENAIRAALVGNARNFEITPPSDIAPYMPKISGGLRIPEGGFGKDVMDLFAPSARANAEAQFYGANPRVAPSSMQSLGYGEDAVAEANAMLASGQVKLSQDQQEAAAQRQALIQALQEDKAEPEKKGGGFWKKLAKVGIIAGAGIATAMTGGAASPLLAAAIGAGSGAAMGALDNGWKGALTGAAMGGVTGGAAGALGGAASSGVNASMGQAIRQTLTNPSNLMQMAGQVTPGVAGTALNLAGAATQGRFGQSPYQGRVAPTLPGQLPPGWQQQLGTIGGRR